jgi:hypothetical protein
MIVSILYISFPGIFRHQFTVPGKYCYWSDYIDQYKTTWFRGCVTVEDLTSYVAAVTVKVNGFEALYQKVAPQSKYLIKLCQLYYKKLFLQ